MSTVGLDIGGAHLKAADTSGVAQTVPFEIWRFPAELAPRLAELLTGFPAAQRIAVTMTAELADCFETKAIGVAYILRALADSAGRRPVVVWSTEGRFVNAQWAEANPLDVAAGNWHALATFAGRWAKAGRGLLVDVGSTTTDLIPLQEGVPCANGATDLGRLLAGELLYSGVTRTPVFALAPAVPLRGAMCPLAAEWFATMRDVYLLLGQVDEQPDDRHTANGRPATRACARDRLARALCCDRTELSFDEIASIAGYLAERQLDGVVQAMRQIESRDAGSFAAIVTSGSGEFLAHKALERLGCNADCRVSLSQMLSAATAEAACAYAVAILASETEFRA